MTSQPARVAVLPYGKKLGKAPQTLPLDALEWPLGMPADIAGQTLADLRPTDHLLTTPTTSSYLRRSFGTAARVSVLVMEPRAVHQKHMRLLRLFRRRFHRILTCDSRLLSQTSNAVFFQTGGCWVPDWQEIDLRKTAMCSLIASGKAKQEGHKLRHSMVEWSRKTGQNIDIMGRGYQPFERKSEGLAPYRYSIVIENAREKDYFTEKLVDALVCNTVPIYWGCPNISDLFDTRGMIICNTMAELQDAVATMSEEDYARRLPLLGAARDVAAGFDDIYGRAARTLLAHD